MNHPIESSTSRTTRGRATIVAPALTWTAVQLAALGMSAAGVKLWARSAAPVEQLALQFMLVAQALTSSLLFPWLMRGARLSAFVIALAGPFVWLAGMLGQATGGEIAQAAALMCVWLIGLGLWANQVTTRAMRAWASAIAGLLVVGGMSSTYLWVEFSGGAVERVRWAAWCIAFVAAGSALVTRVIALLTPSFPQNHPHQKGENGKLDNIG